VNIFNETGLKTIEGNILMNLYLKHFEQNWHEIMLDTHDRLLIAQANIEIAVLISCDSVFADYPVSLLW